jgi:hypothetical protein
MKPEKTGEARNEALSPFENSQNVKTPLQEMRLGMDPAPPLLISIGNRANPIPPLGGYNATFAFSECDYFLEFGYGLRRNFHGRFE